MSELLKAFDTYNELERGSYFTLLYDRLSSELYLSIPMKESKENMDHILDVFDLSSYSLVLKRWKTGDSSDSDPSEDFPKEFLYKSDFEKSLIWVSLDRERLFVTFYYDCKDSELEEWVITKNSQLRKAFGLSQKPTFKVLTKSHSDYDVEDVRTEPIKIDVENHYNADFLNVHNTISTSIESEKPGLILLYGKPGTGKTTYIKSLISKHDKSNFIFIQNEFVSNLLEPGFISFLLEQRDSILIIEDAEKVIKSRELSNQDSVVSTILQLTDGLFSDYLNIKVICTFNTNLSKVDTALLRKGRMIAKYEFDVLSIEKTNALLQTLGLESSEEPLSVAEIFNKDQKSYIENKHGKIGF